MSRPRNETKEDVEREQKTGQLIEGMLSTDNALVEMNPYLKNGMLRKLNSTLENSYRLDWCIVQKFHDDAALNGRPKVVAWAELKCRTHDSAAYPTLMLSMLKWEKGVSLSDASMVPFLVFARFDDRISYYVRQARRDVFYPVEWGGRTKSDRGQDGDIEPVIHIPMAEFETLCELR